MFNDSDPYTPTKSELREMDDFQVMDALGEAGGRAVDDLMRDGVAPLDEIGRDPDMKHPGAGRCECDLGLDGVGPMDIELAIDGMDSMVANGIEEVEFDGL